MSGVNLHVPDELAFDDDFKLTGGRTALSRHVTSLREAPQACEVVFAYRATPRDDRGRRDPSEEAVVATACLRAHGLSDGPCPPETFPVPILPAGFTIVLTTLKHGFTEANGGGFLFDGGVSFLEAPRPDRDYALAFRCEDGARGEHDLGRLTSAWVQILPAGSTLALTGQLGGYPEPGPRSGRCELTFTSSKPPPDKRARPQIHGTYCLAGGTGTPGPCAAPFKVPPAKPLDPAAGKYRMRR